MSDDRVTGAKTAHGKRRPAYVRNPETSRDPPTRINIGTEKHPRMVWPGGKIWRKAREGKL